MKTEILFLLAMTVIFTVGSHFHDVGLILKGDGKEYTAVNGFYEIDARKLFHTGWYMMYFAFFVLVIAYVDLMLKIKGKQL